MWTLSQQIALIFSFYLPLSGGLTYFFYWIFKNANTDRVGKVWRGALLAAGVIAALWYFSASDTLYGLLVELSCVVFWFFVGVLLWGKKRQPAKPNEMDT